MEMIKHMLGLCGESHPSVLWLLPTAGAFIYIIKHNIKWCWTKGCEYCSNKSKKIKNIFRK